MSQKERRAKKKTKTHSLLQFFSTPKSLPTQLSDKNGAAGPTDPTPSNGSYKT